MKKSKIRRLENYKMLLAIAHSPHGKPSRQGKLFDSITREIKRLEGGSKLSEKPEENWVQKLKNISSSIKR